MREGSRSPGVPDAPAGSAEPVIARWELRLPELLYRLRLPPDGVVQVGAHTGQEVAALARCGFRRLVLLEPNRDHTAALWQQLREQHEAAQLPEPPGGLPAREVVVAAAGRHRGHTTLYVTEWDQQASLLPPLPPLAVARQDLVPVVPVRDVQQGCNVLVVDAQGAELEVLAGTDLARLQLAVIEGSTWARYRGGSTLETVADHMRSHSWRPVRHWAHARPYVFDVAWLSPTFAPASR